MCASDVSFSHPDFLLPFYSIRSSDRIESMKASDLIQQRMKGMRACLPPPLPPLPPSYGPIHMDPLYELPPPPPPIEPSPACIIHLTIGTYPSCQTPPTGTILINNTGQTPSGYLPCDGSTVSRATYSALFHVIGEYYGEGNNSTTFHLPQLSNTAQPTVGYIIKT
jgi:hypothetical protein